jgi:16S rRNA (guanine1207-N2)-methyltransferase
MGRRPPQKRKPYGIKSAERLLIEYLPTVQGKNFASTTLGRGQLAAQLSRDYPEATVTCLFLDKYQAERAYEARQPMPGNLKLVCDTDFPDDQYDHIFLPLPIRGERELLRDQLQDAFQHLNQQGTLIVGNEKPKNMWLHEELQKMFPKVTQIEMEKCTILSGQRKGELKKERDFSCEFAFRDQEKLIKAVSRPGVFNHRQLDLGARHLIDAMQLKHKDNVLDLGCGSGCVSFAAAIRADRGQVTAIDSNARAVQCTQIGAELNELENVTVLLDDEVSQPETSSFDVVLANPPYYSNYKIAELFIEGAHRCLKPGGRIYVVAKKPDWYLREMPKMFQRVEVVSDKQFRVIKGVQP